MRVIDITSRHNRLVKDNNRGLYSRRRKIRKRDRTDRLKPHAEDEQGRIPGLLFENIDDTSSTVVWENNTSTNSPDDEEPRTAIKIWINTVDVKPEAPTHILEPGDLTPVGITGESYGISGLDQGMNTFVWVRFFNDYGQSDVMSGLFETTNTPVTVPTPPSNRTTTNITTDSAVLNWDDMSNNEDGFKVYFTNKIVLDPRREIIPILKPAGTTSHTLPSVLINNTTYYWWVSAYNTAGENYEVTPATFNTGGAPAPIVTTELELGVSLAQADTFVIVTLVSNPQQKHRVPIRGELIEINGEIIQVDRVTQLSLDTWRLDVTRRDPAQSTQLAGFAIKLSIPTPNADTGFIFTPKKGLTEVTGTGPGLTANQSEFIIGYDKVKARMRLQRGDSIIINGETMRIFSIVEQIDFARIIVDRLNPVGHPRPPAGTPYIVYRDSNA